MKTSFVFILSFVLFLNSSAQTQSKEYSCLFYNVENLFDVKDDSLTLDEEFTPDGARHWNYKKLERKLLNTSKAIIAAAEWEMPTIIALSEVENRYVLEQLRNETPLKATPYKIIHKESPDFRGIDVALFYNSEEFYPLKYEYIPMRMKSGDVRKTREILYASGILGGVDTVHIFVNHWPSRYGGLMETRELRNDAAALLRNKFDLLMEETPTAKVIILGDFNDQPKDESIEVYLKAKSVFLGIDGSELYNLSETWGEGGEGTLKYQSQWFVFDQIIVSGNLLNASEGLFTTPQLASICKLPFLIEEDKTHGGEKLFRTYSGFRYNGGFSDHFPILLKLRVR